MSTPVVHIVATFTAEPVGAAMGHLFDLAQLPATISFAGFNQVFQELLSPAGAFAQNQSGVNILLVRVEDLAADFASIPQHARELGVAIMTSCANSQVPTLLAICPPSHGALSDPIRASQLSVIERELLSSLLSARSLRVFPSAVFLNLCAGRPYDNPRGERLGGMPFTPEFYAGLGRTLARAVFARTSPSRKVIVLDCDRTLWRGICGEDGLEGIAVDPPYRFLQDFMRRQSEAGMLLCLCSRNNEEDVWEVFKQRTDMVLRREHIVAWRINWERKSENIKALSRELQLGLDSFVFVDDDAAVCAEVEAGCPEVFTLCLGEDADRIPELLDGYWPFDRVTTTSEDRQRTEMYRQNAERHRLLENSDNMDEFLARLDLRCDITPISPDQLLRVAQLSQRTNQFNASGLRRNEVELQRIIEAGAHCMVVHVQDRFGDYGLVGSMVGSLQNGVLDVDTFLLSCRALGRGVEYRMLSAVGRLAADHQAGSVAIRFHPSAKNRPVEEFLERTGAGFKETSGAGVVYRFPSQTAVNIEFKPTAQPTINPGAQEAPTRSSDSPIDWRRRGSGLSTIANEISSGEHLLSRMRPKQASRDGLTNTYVAPDGATETQLVRIWERVLQVSPIGVTDNYFELGGDSLMAVSMFVETEEVLGRQLPLATLFSAPTIRQMSQAIGSNVQTDSWRFLVPIQPHGTRPPLFCMHAAGGNVLFYRDLARHLGPDQPVYGLQAREDPVTGRYIDRVEDMAAQYLAEILRLQPAGPYQLCGSSFGGLLAFEMAQQLSRMNRETALLALFDTYGPGYPELLSRNGAPNRLSRYLSRLIDFQARLRRTPGRERWQFLAKRTRKAVVKVKRTWLRKKNEFAIRYSQVAGRELPKDLQRNHKAIQDALKHYTPKVYPGKITLFRAASQPKDVLPDPLLGWTGLAAGGIVASESPGMHGGMSVDPYAADLARALRPFLVHGPAPVSSTTSPCPVAIQ